MANLTYKWKRFWVPRDGTLDLSDGGFLYPPDSEFAKVHPTDTVPFESISSIKCLILLGEPGIGKTFAMQAERQTIDEQVIKGGGENLGAANFLQRIFLQVEGLVLRRDAGITDEHISKEYQNSSRFSIVRL